MLILVRHPPVDLPAGICYGRTDVGIACVSHIDGILDKIPKVQGMHIWSSPSRRCACVAAAAAAYFGVESQCDARLRELDFGAWEGLAWSDVPRLALDAWAADLLGFAPPAGESGAELILRVESFFHEVLQPGTTHIVVSHGGPLRILAALAQGMPINLLAPAPPLGSVEVLQNKMATAT